MRGLLLITLALLTGCTTTTTIHRDDQGRICEITQPRKSLVQTPTVTVDSRDTPDAPGLGAGVGMGFGAAMGQLITGD